MAGIYLHIPFCHQACHYCDFHFSTQLKHTDSIIKSIGLEIQKQSHWFKDEPTAPDTLYFGGGTPSILSHQQLLFLFETIDQYFPITSFQEITLEVNPEDVNQQNILFWKSLGINRISIGIQSFDPTFLQQANRNHSSRQAHDALHLLSMQNEITISADLMFGFFGQTLEDVVADLKKFISFSVQHLSAYCLTIEPKTVLGIRHKKGEIPDQDEALLEEMFHTVRLFLLEHGYDAYEISNFCKPLHHSKHNSSYWSGDPYLGLGPSAHSFKSNKRYWNISHNTLYQQKLSNNEVWYEQENLSRQNRFNEIILTGLRTSKGADLHLLKSFTTSTEWDEFQQSIHQLVMKEVLITNNERIILTNKGLWQADGIASSLFLV